MSGAVSRAIRRSGEWSEAHGRIALGYDARFLRRRRLVAADGSDFLVDLPETVSVADGDAFELADGRLIAVEAAAEPLYAVRGDLVRLAWHIGNRHAPCEIGEDRLLIRRDHVLRDMVLRLGGEVAEFEGPFTPEGGAYGHGRVMGHEHHHGGHGHDHEGHGEHAHSHDHHHEAAGHGVHG
jgi:urease accessory protein